jgi:sialic acid synthase SpsE
MKIDLNKKVFIIAEIGKNFIQTKKEQSLSVYLKNAKKLVDAAKDAGADAVKFQTHTVEDEQFNVKVVSHHFKGSDRFSWVKRNTFPVEKFWKPLKAYCDKKKIIFFSTPMSRGAAKILQNLGVKLWKVGSGDILDFVMLDYIRQTKKPIIISSGMSTLSEVKKSIDFLNKKNKDIILLHCVSKYPCPPEELNLKTIGLLQKKFDFPVGFSDHSLGINSALAAATLGARVIEKHFSANRNLWGSDHKVSMTPGEFKRMVAGIRKIEAGYLYKINQRMMGKKIKKVNKDEEAFRPLFRKSLVAACDIPKGRVLKADMIYAMRPQKYLEGLRSEEYEDVIGKKTKQRLIRYQPIDRNKIM